MEVDIALSSLCAALHVLSRQRSLGDVEEVIVGHCLSCMELHGVALGAALHVLSRQRSLGDVEEVIVGHSSCAALHD